MRSGVICVLLVICIRREGSGAASEEFRPMPIPLNEWREVRGWREAREPPPEPAPAHYWESALRHSVYLTLVRDKIDQLVADGDTRPAADLDDRDLWDKVKRAPFEATGDEDPAPFGDVTVMAKGRLMEENGGFRFTEDDRFKEKCAHDKCMEGVKALWSVKRVRQRDSDASGRYHYELTFSVITQKKHKKPHEKPERTFTVRETVPERIVEVPQQHRYYEPPAAPVPVPVQPPRAERALWFHKNIGPVAYSPDQARQYHNGLDRLFSSLFSDDDEDDIPAPRYKSKQYYPPPPVYQQYSKAGYVGSPSEHQQKKLIPNNYKPPRLHKLNHYSRPIPPPPPPPAHHHHHHYLDIEQIGVVSNPYQDHRYGPPTKPGKTQRPPVLPTPPNPVLPQKNFTFETTTPMKSNQSEDTTQKPETVHPPKTYNKQKPTPVKISYVTDHVRPPVYNAPPGVFVTMDKKPFKPMPPLRLVHSSKFQKPPRPTDFRPSPQVLDIQFSEPDPLFDTAFRPITVNYANNNTTEKAVVAASDNHFRKSNTTAKKPPKKNEIVKAQRVTTTAPEIITAHSVEEDSDAEWTNILGAFAKTTPMVAEKEKAKSTETTTPLMTSTTVTTTTTTLPAPTTTIRKRTTTTTEAPSTTPKPKKRTRPPPKFTKPEKVKKHKRITTTTTTETPYKRNKEQDLTPQASSASATAKLSSNTTSSTTTTSTTTTSTTTTTTTQPTTTPVQTTTTTQAATTTTEHKPTPGRETETASRKNRYRQSTLKYRSTSGNDKKEEKARTILPPTGKFPPRRKGSKYQNYISSTPKFSDMQFDEEGREDHIVSPYKSKSISTTESVITSTITQVASTPRTTPAYEEVADHVYITSESPEYSMSQEDKDDENLDEQEEDKQESRDNLEYVPSTSALVTPSDTTNEIVEIEDEPLEIIAEVADSTTASAPKNKTKCKKKKLHNLTNTIEETKPETTEPELAVSENLTTSSTAVTTETVSTPDIFDEIFGGFTFDDSAAESNDKEATPKPALEEQESTNQEQYIKADDDFEDFFQAFDTKHREEHRDGKYDDEYEYDTDKDLLNDADESLFRSEEDQKSSRDTQDDEEFYDDYQERPYSLLELMNME